MGRAELEVEFIK
jgi:hypothetical protein